MLNLVGLWKKGGGFEVIHQAESLWVTEKLSPGLGDTKISTFTQGGKII